jgi:predicted restriction endonuclease
MRCREKKQREREEVGTHTLEFYRNKNRQNHPSWKFAEVRGHARKAHAHLLKRCQVCGYDNHVELAHIIALSKWPLSATLNEVNAAGNILLLCPNHHWEFDNGLLRLETIPSR